MSDREIGSLMDQFIDEICGKEMVEEEKKEEIKKSFRDMYEERVNNRDDYLFHAFHDWLRLKQYEGECVKDKVECNCGTIYEIGLDRIKSDMYFKEDYFTNIPYPYIREIYFCSFCGKSIQVAGRVKYIKTLNRKKMFIYDTDDMKTKEVFIVQGDRPHTHQYAIDHNKIVSEKNEYYERQNYHMMKYYIENEKKEKTEKNDFLEAWEIENE